MAESLLSKTRLLEALKEISELRQPPVDFDGDAYSASGGNFDDAYALGFDHGEIAAYNRCAEIAERALRFVR